MGPLWLGALPHGASALRQAEDGLRRSLEALGRQLGVDVEPRFRFHTKGATWDGDGLGFGFVWLPEPVAEQVLDVGRLDYGAGWAVVRRSRGAVAEGSGAVAVAVAGTFRVELETLEQWQEIFQQVRLDVRVSEKVGVEALCQLLRRKRSFLRRLPLGVVLWRPEDIASAHQGLLEAARAARQAGHALIFLEMAPHGQGVAAESFMAGVREVGCEAIDWATLLDLYPSAGEDPSAAACAMILRRATSLLLSSQYKVFVADCDHTLWEGVVSEDGVDGVSFTAAHLALQRKLVALQASGRLICLASRNVDHEVLAVLARKDSVLKVEHLTAWEVHPGPKPESLRRLASSLELSLDSFVFLDDNPFEVADVSRSLPEVLCVHVPTGQEALQQLVRHAWLLDACGASSSEDTRRTELYRQNAARRAERQRHESLEEFLEALEVQVTIRSAGEADAPRLSQLCARTNQFNTTQLRLSESEVRAWSGRVLVGEVRDRFGDYGLVAAAFCSTAPHLVVVDCLAMSCRVLHRGVELELLRAVSHLAPVVRVSFVASAKNHLARGFLLRLHAASGGASEPSEFSFASEQLRDLRPSEVTVDWARAAVAREAQVAGYSNVVEAEDWMGVASGVSGSDWSVLERIGRMGAAIPKGLESYCSLFVATWCLES